MQKPNYQRMLEQLIASIPEGEAPRLLLHSCCGPCSIMPVKRLQDEGFTVTALSLIHI